MHSPRGHDPNPDPRTPESRHDRVLRQEGAIVALGRRGEGWVVAQFLLLATAAVLGVIGPPWPQEGSLVLAAIGWLIGLAGLALTVAGAVALGPSLTPFPRPSPSSTFREVGPYRFVRHPIYGGLLLIASGWSLVMSPLALVATAFLAIVLELKSRAEESMLTERYPEYEAYRQRVPWRFVPGIR